MHAACACSLQPAAPAPLRSVIDSNTIVSLLLHGSEYCGKASGDASKKFSIEQVISLSSRPTRVSLLTGNANGQCQRGNGAAR